MRIAQVSPLYERVPPVSYGGTERVVSYLTEALVEAGHDVTLFASGDSITQARLVPACPQALRLGRKVVDQFAWHILEIEQVAQHADRFDVIHYHNDYFHYPLSRRVRTPHVTTLHGRLDLADLIPLYREFDDMPVVSISDAQRRPLPWIEWVGTVHHGLPPDLYRFVAGAGSYLAFLGRISPEKRLDRAIEIARRTGILLKVAAKVDRADEEYFHARIEPLMNDPLVEYIGEIGEADKQEFLGNALALLFPIDWPEPFGLVLIEAMACGTPTIAFGTGSVPEIIDEGVTGFIVRNVDEAVASVGKLDRIDRAGCRRIFDERFTVTRMAQDYVEIYERLRSQAFRPRIAA